MVITIAIKHFEVNSGIKGKVHLSLINSYITQCRKIKLFILPPLTLCVCVCVADKNAIFTRQIINQFTWIFRGTKTNINIPIAVERYYKKCFCFGTIHGLSCVLSRDNHLRHTCCHKTQPEVFEGADARTSLKINYKVRLVLKKVFSTMGVLLIFAAFRLLDYYINFSVSILKDFILQN